MLEPIPGVIPALETIRDGKSLTCKTTGQEYNLPLPTVVVIDVSQMAYPYHNG